MGGGDLDNVTFKVLSAFDQVDIDGIEIIAVVGAANPHLDSLKKVTENSKHKIDLLQNVNAMSDLMVWADMAISSAGSTCWELAYLGLPAILIISSANQAMNLESLEKNGAVNFVSNRMSIPTKMISREIHDLIMKNDLRNDMSYKGKLLVDGNGSERVVQAFQILNKKAKDNNERENTTVNI
jgi:spore coat polysaccharide biosynthesis predicted glycosyltransferase SpsG